MLGELPFWVAVLRVATPLIFGTLGVLLCERAGVLQPRHRGHDGRRCVRRLVRGLSRRCRCGAACSRRRRPRPPSACCTRCSPSAWRCRSTSPGSASRCSRPRSRYFAYRVAFPKVSTPPTIQPFTPMDWLPLPILPQQTPLTLLALLLVPFSGLWPLSHAGRSRPADGGREPAGGREPGHTGGAHANHGDRRSARR